MKMAKVTILVLVTIITISVLLVLNCSAVFAAAPTLGYDNDGGRVFDDGSGNKFLAWGIDTCNWTSTDMTIFHSYCDMLQYCNCTFVSIPIHWKDVEPTQDNYIFSIVQQQFDMARDHGLKVVAYWYGSNFAAGDNQFVPDYILNDKNTYKRVVGSCFAIDKVLCPNNTATLNREKTAYYNLVNFVKSYNTSQTSNVVLSMLCGAEKDLVQSLANWNPPLQTDVRCYCDTCNSLYQGEGAIAFDKTSFSKYVKSLIDYGATTGYDIPTYSQVCAWSWFPGWRYAEDPNVLKSTVNRSNHFVVPSIADCSSISNYITDMSYFTPTNIPGNIMFTDGIGQGAYRNNNVECAPWINILYYGGLGAIYWDNGINDPNNPNWSQSLLYDTTLQTKYRTYFGPLKGMEYQLARLKCSATKKFWWMPGTTYETGSTTNYSLNAWNSNNDYGVFFDLGTNEFCFSGSNYAGAYTLKVSKTGGFQTNWKFERGYYDMVTGAWIKYGDIYPTYDSTSVTINVNDDSGEYNRVVIRGYYTTSTSNLAKNKTVECDSSQGGTTPAMAVDENLGSKWASAYGETHWLKVDLGASCTVHRWVVKHAGTGESWGTQSINTRDYKLQVSPNGVDSWTDVDSVTGNIYNQTDRIINTTGRYFRLYITNPQTETTYRCARIYEFELYQDGNNLSLTAAASSSSVNSGYPASNVKDGNLNTATMSLDNPGFPQYITLQWSSGQTFNKVNLVSHNCKGQAPTDWDVQVSDDGVTGWTTVASSGHVIWTTTNETRENKALTFTQVTNKKGVRIKINNANMSWNHFAVDEIEVTN